ncbi:hypothetical protein CSUB01_04877 [Colletotrichum sublineola]|uniref:Uncharacterized protein n=1 Tax=Colletotrichum sublineola TaxID=1173701 RepID=A0A066XR47_COLSU|nr:hypothetical protein CSUB01_04877 [Colletotrichum sublineola]
MVVCSTNQTYNSHIYILLTHTYPSKIVTTTNCQLQIHTPLHFTMAAFTLIFTPTTTVYGRSGYNKDGDDEEKDSGRSGYNKDGNDDDETQNKGRSGYNKDGDDEEDK